MALTRRTFLTRVGQAGGVSAAFLSMRALGLAPMESPVVEPIAAEPGIGKGVRVVILGGGIAGLVAAYELRALGYTCTVLEARHRPGGRNWTVRSGDKVVFTDGTTQTCDFDAEESRRSVERLHPGHGKELEKRWRQIPFNEGSWIGSYGPGQRQGNPRDPTGRMQASGEGNEGYETLLQPDGPIYFVGDHVSHIVGWQEGAAVSSLRAIGMLNDRVKTTKVSAG